ncbi:MAG TPA: glycosyltransferase family 39 protein [Candidatus Angelobacter sp.]|nr:glycosyltransferase family 39 protein [Candidatus Angelobacter sp.]
MKALFDLVRRNKLFFLLVTIAALALRLYFVFRFPVIEGDTFIYGDIARNWLNHGIYGVSDHALVRPTLIRLPGYPAFLALVFSIFGQEHYHAVMVIQALIDTNTCLVIAGIALELSGTRAAKIAYLLAALCPFTASYTAAPLSETLAIFCTAHALYYGIRGLKALNAGEAGTLLWLACGLWAAAGIYMRPDDGLVLVPLLLALLILFLCSLDRAKILSATAILVAASLLPLVPWTLRNSRTFHVFQPLASRYANDPGEFVPMGFNRWVKTWIADYVSTEEVFWHVPGDSLDIDNLPERAFDSKQQYDQTDELIADYNLEHDIDRDMDQRFAALAAERINHHRFRYYVRLPFLRIADMWLRPRTELLPVETRWWEFSEHRGESVFALVWAGLNLALLLAALRGWLVTRLGIYGVVLIGFSLLRSTFLGSLENPEPRYMLECFPVVLALAGVAFTKKHLAPDRERPA